MTAAEPRTGTVMRGPDPLPSWLVGGDHENRHLWSEGCDKNPPCTVHPDQATALPTRERVDPGERARQERVMVTGSAPGVPQRVVTGYNPSSEVIRDVFDSLPPKVWDVSVWRTDGNHEEGRIDKADALRLINAILGVPR